MPHLCALEAWREGGREGVKHWAWLSKGNEGELAFISAGTMGPGLAAALLITRLLYPLHLQAVPLKLSSVTCQL